MWEREKEKRDVYILQIVFGWVEDDEVRAEQQTGASNDPDERNGMKEQCMTA